MHCLWYLKESLKLLVVSGDGGLFDLIWFDVSLNQIDLNLNLIWLRLFYFQVHWVQCDKCELWYHLFCIGLKPHDIKEDEDFNCNLCKVVKKNDTKIKNNDTSASDMDTEWTTHDLQSVRPKIVRRKLARKLSVALKLTNMLWFWLSK